MTESEAAPSERERWDRKHREGRAQPPRSPDPFFLRALRLLSREPPQTTGAGGPGRAVDLASGRGRHALELARRGWEVEAWDLSPVALELVAARAAQGRLPVTTRVVDLTRTAALPAKSFDLAVLVNLLERPLHPVLQDLVRPGGHLIFATFTVDRAGDHPRREWCLERGELAGGLAGFRMLFQEEAWGRAGILARRKRG